MATVQQIIRDIKAVRIQGAREVAKAGLKALSITAQKSRAKTKKAFVQELQKVSKQLIATRPTEPALRSSLAKVLARVQSSEIRSVELLRRHAVRACEDITGHLRTALLQIASFGSDLVKEGDTVLTHCHSHSVVEILKQAKARGRNFRVIVTETRPLYQGLKTARDLLKVKIPVIYGVDSAIGSFIRDATKVLVGCDAILLDGSIVNKVGTFPLALLAREFGKPFYVSGETVKVTESVKLEERDPKEVIDPKKLKGARVANPAFDITPAKLIEAIITERGLVKPEMVRRFA
jgi:ribose 1,5-bisphosphate isomerase